MDEIHHAFRRLAKLWHPDRYTSAPAELRSSAERRMRALTRAYAVLGDDIERHAYDRRHGLVGATVAPPSELWTTHAHAAPNAYMHPYTQASKITPIGDHSVNGAGLFAGILCSILAFALLGRLLAGGLNGWEGALVTLLLLGLMILAGLFFTNETPLAEKAREWAEGEPAGMREPRWQHEPAHTAHHAQKERAEQTEAEDDGGLAAFNKLVDEALAGIPDDFKAWLDNVVVQVEDTPSEETLRQSHVDHGHTLLGLYVGVPLTAMGADRAGPEIVTIFRRTIERYCHGDPDRIREQVRATVLHELAHHFGIDHEEMPDWVK